MLSFVSLVDAFKNARAAFRNRRCFSLLDIQYPTSPARNLRYATRPQLFRPLPKDAVTVDSSQSAAASFDTPALPESLASRESAIQLL